MMKVGTMKKKKKGMLNNINPKTPLPLPHEKE